MKPSKKIQRRLDQRLAGYEKLDKRNAKSFTRPGSRKKNG